MVDMTMLAAMVVDAVAEEIGLSWTVSIIQMMSLKHLAMQVLELQFIGSK
jgi:hypothetical protein